MNEPRHHAEAMRRKRRSLGVVVAALVVAVFVVYNQWLGIMSIPLALAALIGAAIAANRILTCPACGQRLGSIFQKACSHCGAMLVDQPMAIAAKDRPAEAGALEYMAESRRILRRWAGVRKFLGWSVYVVGVVAALLGALGMEHTSLSGAIVGGLFLGAIGAAVTWLILVYVVDNAFGTGFLLLRGRCPVCRAWFNPPTSFGPASISMDYSLPQFCPSCSAKLA